MNKEGEKDGEPVKILTGHKNWITSIALHQKTLYSSSMDCHIFGWDMTNTEKHISNPTRTLKAHKNAVMCLKLNQNTLFSGGFDCLVLAWDLNKKPAPKQDTEPMKVMKGHQGSIIALEIAGGVLYSASRDNSIRGWDLDKYVNEDEQPVKILTSHSSSVISLAASEGILYSGSYDRTICAWDILKTGEFDTNPVITINAHKNWVSGLVIFNNQLFSGSHDCTITSWKLKSDDDIVGDYLLNFKAHESWINCMVVEDHMICTGGCDNVVKVWDYNKFRDNFSKKNHDNLIPTKTLEGHKNPVTCLAISKNVLYSGSEDHTIIAWRLNKTNPESSDIIKMMVGHKNWVMCIAVEDDLLYSGSYDFTIKVWNLLGKEAEDTTPLITINAHSNSITSLVISNGVLYSSSNDRKIKGWKISTLKDKAVEPVKILTAHKDPVICLAVQGNILFSGSYDNTIKAWDLSKGQKEDRDPIRTMIDHKGSITGLFVCKNMLFSSSEDHQVKVWNLQNVSEIDDEPINSLVVHENTVTCLALVEGKLITGSKDCNIRAWDFFKTKELDQITDFDDLCKEFFNELLFKNLSSQENLDLSSAMLNYMKNYYMIQFEKYPLLVLLTLKYDTEILDMYLPIYSKYEYPLIEQLICLYHEFKTSPTPKLAQVDQVGGDDEVQRLYGGDWSQMAENILQTIFYLLRLMSDPKNEALSRKMIGIHSVVTPEIFHKLLLFSSSDVRTALSRLLFNEVRVVRCELKKRQNNIVELKEIVEENALQSKIKFLMREKPEQLKNYIFQVTNFPIDISNGSINSFKLFRTIKNMTSEQQADFDPIINSKWKKVKPFLLVLLLIFLALTVLLNLYIFVFDKHYSLIFPIVFLNTLILLWEVKGMFTIQKYFSYFYNYIDILVILGIYFIVFVNIAEETKTLAIFNFFFTLVINIRSLTYFRVIDSLRYLIEMIIKIYVDIIAFLVIITLFVFIYTIGLLAVDEVNQVAEGENVITKFKVGIELSLGNWDNIPEEWNTWNWGLFILSNITFTIMLLNLIIAIVSKTFDDYYDNQADVDRNARLELILELDQVLKFKKGSGFDEESFRKNSSYFHMLKPEDRANTLNDLGDKLDVLKHELVHKVESLEERVHTSLREMFEEVGEQDARNFNSLRTEMKNYLTFIKEKVKNGGNIKDANKEDIVN